jgi:hypothetical protein
MTTEQIKTGIDLLRATVRVRNRSPHALALIAREVEGVSAGMLEEFSAGRAELSVAALQALGPQCSTRGATAMVVVSTSTSSPLPGASNATMVMVCSRCWRCVIPGTTTATGSKGKHHDSGQRHRSQRGQHDQYDEQTILKQPHDCDGSSAGPPINARRLIGLGKTRPNGSQRAPPMRYSPASALPDTGRHSDASIVRKVLWRGSIGAGPARPHLLRISGGRKSVGLQLQGRQHVCLRRAFCPTQCPLRTNGDQIFQRREMSRWANT